MLVVMQEGAEEAQTQNVIDRLVSMGFIVHRSSGIQHTVLGGVGPVGDVDPIEFEVMPGVKECHRIVSPYKLASRHFKPAGTMIKIGDVEIGGDRVVVMAGPCSVENRDQIGQVAEAVAASGAKVLRGGAFKPRTSPYSFQGMGEDGLKLLREAADRNHLLLVSEVMDQTQIPLIADYVDILQVGARNMQNYNLLRELGALRKPILLKRGISATIEELLLSAEYILSGGNYDVILCERGIRTFETLHAQHHGHFRHPGGEVAFASAHRGRPIARNRPPRQGAAHGTRGSGGRRRRLAGGSASRSRPRAQRRRAVAVSAAVRRTDGSVAHHRRRAVGRSGYRRAKATWIRSQSLAWD